MSKGWDNATLKKLKALTGKGLSTAEIGKRLGISKNAVVGKLYREGWNTKTSGANTDDTTKSKEKSNTTRQKVTVTKKALVAKPTKKKSLATVITKTLSKKDAAQKKATGTAKDAKTNTKKAESKATAPAIITDKKSLNKSLAMHQRIIQHSLEMANLKPNQCRWPIGDPDSEHFHFCGETVFVGKPYCYEHCKQAYQFAPPKKK